MSRLDNDLFFDGRIVHVTREEHAGEQFFLEPAEDQWRWWEKILQREWRLAMFFFGFGFLTVFVNQMPIHLQIVLGAPIFEEMFKFGFALLLVFWVPWGAIRIPLALAIGAGFGVLEHYVTYAAESDFGYFWRVAFHSLSTGTSMIFYQLMRNEDRLTWPVAMAPSILIHYINNTGAVLFLILAPNWSGVEWFSVANIAALGVLAVLGLSLRRPARAAIWGLTRQLWAKALQSEHQTLAKLGSLAPAPMHRPEVAEPWEE
ncbi:MAG: hypothetical protein ACPHK8_04805 [Thermoplasmatota archaeon]